MSLMVWLVVAAVVWALLATGLAVLLGRMIRERDRQVPPGDAGPDQDGLTAVHSHER